MTRALRNILYFVLGLLLGCVSALSFAADGTDAGVPAIQYTPMTWSTGNWSSTSIPEVCNMMRASMESGGNPPTWGQPPTPANEPAGSGIMYCKHTTVDKVTGNVSAPQYRQMGGSCPTGYQMDLAFPTPFDYRCKTGVQCPVGSSLANGKCTCNTGLVFYDGQCKSPVCTGNTDTGQRYWDLGTSPGGNPALVRCLNGCIATYSGDNGSATGMKNGVRHYYAKGSYTQTGNGSADRCNGGPNGGASSNPNTPSTTDGTATKPPDTCPAGHGTVKINGVTNCVNASNGSTTAPPPQTENKVTTTNTTNNPDGSTTVTKTTTNNHTGGTTTVTETYGPGVTPGTGQPTETTTVSTGGGAGGGTGSGNGEGNGDKDACEDDPERVGCKHLDEITGEVPDGPDISNSQENLTFTPVSGFGSGSYSCPQNPTMTLSLLGKSITAFDYGPACQFANGIRPLVVAFAALAAALIGLGVGRRD